MPRKAYEVKPHGYPTPDSAVRDYSRWAREAKGIKAKIGGTEYWITDIVNSKSKKGHYKVYLSEVTPGGGVGSNVATVYPRKSLFAPLIESRKHPATGRLNLHFKEDTGFYEQMITENLGDFASVELIAQVPDPQKAGTSASAAAATTDDQPDEDLKEDSDEEMAATAQKSQRHAELRGLIQTLIAEQGLSSAAQTDALRTASTISIASMPIIILNSMEGLPPSIQSTLRQELGHAMKHNDPAKLTEVAKRVVEAKASTAQARAPRASVMSRSALKKLINEYAPSGYEVDQIQFKPRAAKKKPSKKKTKGRGDD